jgi:hypothetical protein
MEDFAMPNEVLPLVTAAMAAVGAVLGVINTCNALDRQKVKLIVRPAYGLYPGYELMVTINVINLSAFPVTISEMGFTLEGGKKTFSTRNLTNGKSLPVRLESREDVTALYYISEIDCTSIRMAFSRTSCGEIVFGDSPALNQIRSGKAPKD